MYRLLLLPSLLFLFLFLFFIPKVTFAIDKCTDETRGAYINENATSAEACGGGGAICYDSTNANSGSSKYFCYKIMASGPFKISVDRAVYEKDRQVHVTYSGLERDNCLAFFVKKDGKFIKYTGTSLGSSCFLDDTVFTSMQVAQPSSKFVLGTLDDSVYEVHAKRYSENCGVTGKLLGTCTWDLKGTSNSIFLTVSKETSGDLKMDVTITPSTGNGGDTFVAKGKVTSSSGKAVAKLPITLNIIAPSTITLGAGATDDSGNYSIDITNRLTDSDRGTFTVEATTQVGDVITKGSTSLTILSSKKDSVAKKCVGEQPKNTVCLNGKWVAASKAAGIIDNERQCIATAIGCVPYNVRGFIDGVLAWSAGIAGGLAFLLMILGSLQMLTSQGNPDQLKKGREQFVAAISGLLFIIFSITLLQIIGTDILGIFPAR